jgi:hypothetical protein
VKITLLDDYQDVALGMGPWDRLDAEVVALHAHLLGDGLVTALAGSEVVVAMRERTPFDRPARPAAGPAPAHHHRDGQRLDRPGRGPRPRRAGLRHPQPAARPPS